MSKRLHEEDEVPLWCLKKTCVRNSLNEEEMEIDNGPDENQNFHDPSVLMEWGSWPANSKVLPVDGRINTTIKDVLDFMLKNHQLTVSAIFYGQVTLFASWQSKEKQTLRRMQSVRQILIELNGSCFKNGSRPPIIPIDTKVIDLVALFDEEAGSDLSEDPPFIRYLLPDK